MAKSPFRYFKTSPEIIQLAVMMCVRFPLSPRNVEDLLHERGIDICHESVRLWGGCFGPIFAGKIRTKRTPYMREHNQWQWHLKRLLEIGCVRPIASRLWARLEASRIYTVSNQAAINAAFDDHLKVLIHIAASTV